MILKFDNYHIGRVLLTGAAGSGKTTIITELRKIGYDVVDEVARQLISYLQEHDKSKLPWNDRPAFQKLIEERQVSNFLSNKNAFFDRGMPDEIAYSKAYGSTASDWFIDNCKELKYDKVYLFPPYKEIFKNDSERKETFEESVRIYTFLEESYLALGYKPIYMINDSVENRLKFMFNTL